MSTLDPSQLVARFSSVAETTTDPDILASHGGDWSNFPRRGSVVVFPRSTEEVQAIVHVAIAHRIPLVPSGGRTGLSGGACATAGEVIVSFDKMNRIGAVDLVDSAISVEAGAITANVQAAARDADSFFPVAFASQGSSQIGGNIATNAGGINVLRYGMTRRWVSGLTVVTGEGKILTLNRGLHKNATGYSLLDLMIGSEGTLGFITEITLQLTTPPPRQQTLLLALADFSSITTIFTSAKSALRLSAFEFFSEAALQAVLEKNTWPHPFPQNPGEYYALISCDELLEDELMAWFANLLEAELITDGVMGQSEEQAQRLWQYRENITESVAHFTPYKNDISVRISQVPGLLSAIDALFAHAYAELRVLWFGHLGDGNLHISILKPAELSYAVFQQHCEQVNQDLFTTIKRFGGSISAEHGIGLLKKPYLHYSRSQDEIAYMKQIKHLFDPYAILNPGKLLDVEWNGNA